MPSPKPVLERAQALGPLLREGAPEAERIGRLPRATVDALVEASVFQMLVPASIGGLEVEPSVLVDVIEELSAADGSAGWCAMIGASTAVMSGRLESGTAAEVFAAPGSIVGGVAAPFGKAIAVEGGYRISGRWPFASGSQHSTFLVCAALVDGVDDGPPRHLLPFLPANEVTIVENWDVSGLRATGSHDMQVEDVFVPFERVTGLTGRPVNEAPLYQLPVLGLLAVSVGAVAAGIARSAIAELREVALNKVPTGSQRRLAERSSLLSAYSEATALHAAAAAFLRSEVQAAWATVVAGEVPGHALRARLRLAASTAATFSARAVDLCYNAAGATAIRSASPLQRQFRDVHVVTQHIMASPQTLELTGRVFLDLPFDSSGL